MKNQSLYSCLVVLLILAGCDSKKGLNNQCSVDYDQKGLFENIIKQQIQPGYESLLTTLTKFKTDYSTFQASPSTGLLDALESSFTDSYMAWKGVEIFGFGPAEKLDAQSYFNFFPINISLVEQQLDAGFDPDNSSLFDKGLPVLDYFIFNKASPEDRIQYLTQPKVTEYFNQVLDKMISVATEILAGYRNGYTDEFISSTGTAAGTTLSLLINALSQYFENNRRNQLGIPSGALTLDIPNPDKTEAYYSSISLALLKKGVETSRLLYEGKMKGGGIKDYVTALEANNSGEQIANEISNAFNTVLFAIEKIDEPLSRAVSGDREHVAALYRAMSDQVIHLKTDLPARTCISITYVDNPSDTD